MKISPNLRLRLMENELDRSRSLRICSTTRVVDSREESLVCSLPYKHRVGAYKVKGMFHFCVDVTQNIMLFSASSNDS